MFVHVTNNFINCAFYSVFYLKRPKLKKILFHVNVYEGGTYGSLSEDSGDYFLCNSKSQNKVK